MTANRWAALLLGLYVVLALPSLGQPLLESHAYRQTQTAYTAVLYARDGIDLLRPPLPVLGAPGIVPLEFPLFQAIAALVIMLGAEPDFAMRATGLASFMVTAGFVYLVARRLIGNRGALIALAAFLFNPLALLYGRSSLIEYLATAFGMAFVYFFIRWVTDGREWHWVVALIAASAVVLVKVTTAPIFLLPALLWQVRSGRRAFHLPALWLLLLVAGIVGVSWTLYADSIRSATPATEFLTARNSAEWLFGSLGQRLDIAEWRVPLIAFLMLTGFGVVIWGYLAWRYATRHVQREFNLGILAMVAVTPMVLFNLYAIHDYYYAAVAPFIALGIGMGVEHLLEMRRSVGTRRLMVGLAGAWAATLIGASGSWTLIYGTPPEQEQVFETAAFIRSHSDPDDWVVIEGFGWNSTFLYYADRRGFADPTGDNLLERGDIDMDQIVDDPIYGPFFRCDAEGNCVVSETR